MIFYSHFKFILSSCIDIGFVVLWSVSSKFCLAIGLRISCISLLSTLIQVKKNMLTFFSINFFTYFYITRSEN